MLDFSYQLGINTIIDLTRKYTLEFDDSITVATLLGAQVEFFACVTGVSQSVIDSEIARLAPDLEPYINL